MTRDLLIQTILHCMSLKRYEKNSNFFQPLELTTATVRMAYLHTFINMNESQSYFCFLLLILSLINEYTKHKNSCLYQEYNNIYDPHVHNDKFPCIPVMKTPDTDVYIYKKKIQE